MTDRIADGRPPRLMSLDAYRGLVMLAMASGGLGLTQVAKHFPTDEVWRTIGYQFEHVEWVGCSLWDMIQPSFMFMVGVAMPFSYATRRARGDSWTKLFLHAIRRSIVLILLGIFLQSHGAWTDFTFFNVLMQIGMGYALVFLVLDLNPIWQVLIALAILAGDWGWFYMYHMPSPEYLAEMGIAREPQPILTGIAEHWGKNVNAAASFDRWFLNLFPREPGHPFKVNGGGYTTLNFIPSMATMIFGAVAGRCLIGPRSNAAKIGMLIGGGLLCLGAAVALDPSFFNLKVNYETVCPIVKRIWTPSWVFLSTAYTCWTLAAFFLIIDVWKLRAWSLPLVVVGVNSIAMYVMAQIMGGFVRDRLGMHFGFRHEYLTARYGRSAIIETWWPTMESVAALLVLWLICLYMYRNKIYIRI